jgi:hypothetical protein
LGTDIVAHTRSQLAGRAGNFQKNARSASGISAPLQVVGGFLSCGYRPCRVPRHPAGGRPVPIVFRLEIMDSGDGCPDWHILLFFKNPELVPPPWPGLAAPDRHGDIRSPWLPSRHNLLGNAAAPNYTNRKRPHQSVVMVDIGDKLSDGTNQKEIEGLAVKVSRRHPGHGGSHHCRHASNDRRPRGASP